MVSGPPSEPANGNDNATPQHANRADPSGTANDFVQARDVHGGVHFHSADRSTEPRPRQLPGDVRGFVDRLAELARLDEILADDGTEPPVAGVLIIAGTAGVGKTSLALHWAHTVRHRFPDGQFYVNLRGYDPGQPVTPEQVLDRFLRALGVPGAAISSDLETQAAMYRSLLADRRILVVLDNAATVGQVRPLLPGTAGCLVVVTSRSRLSGLVAREGARRLTLEVLPESDAVDLLRTVTAGYRTADDPARLVELARLCARLPLALRIAAERAASRPLMPLDELIGDLRDESGLWEALTTEDDEGADTVRTVFAWSYRALPEAAARLFRLLGLHPGAEFSTPAAAALAGVDQNRVRHLLDVLVGAHLVEHHAAGRYQFHDLLRAYATDQTSHEESTGERSDVLRRILTWYLHTADAALARIVPLDRRVALDPPTPDVTLLVFIDRAAADQWYETEQRNLAEATRVAFNAGLDQIAWQLPAVLRGIQMMRGSFAEWIAMARVGLDAARRIGDSTGAAELLESLGKAYFQSRQLVESEECHRAALAIRQETGDRFGEAVSVNALGLLGLRHRRLREAMSYFRQAVAIFAELGERRWEAVLLGNLAETSYELAEFPAAVDLLTTALGVYRELGDRFYEGNALFTLSMTQREMGRTSEGRASIEAALAIAREADNHLWEAHWLLELARAQRAAGDLADALVSCQHAATIQRRLGDRSREAQALGGAGEAYREIGRPEEAADFHRRAVTVHREFGDRWQLGIALDNLATALNAAGDAEEARTHWAEASRILASFDDPKAVAMVARVNRFLAAR